MIENPLLVTLLEYTATIIGVVGILLIVYVSLVSAARIIKIELSEKKRFVPYEHVKRIFIQKIILALDFFVAADLILLSIVSDMQEIFSLALIVGIRTVLSWSLSRESHLHKE